MRIGSTLSVLKKEGRVTYFVGPDSYSSHRETDAAGQRLALATLLANGHVRASQVEVSGLGMAHRTLMHWTRQLDQKGSGSFYAPRRRRGGAVMTPEKAAQCGRFLAAGETVAEVARRTGVGESTLRKAVRGGRRNTPKKVTLDSLPENQRPRQLAPLGKMLTDTVKMIAYRAETALVGLVRPHLAKEEEARALVRELLVSSADLQPDEENNTLTIRIHRMACPAHDKAIAALLAELNQLAFHHPQTHARLIYELS